MSNDPAARVNGNLLKSYVNGTVRLVGRVQNVSSNQVTMEAADGVSIIVQTDTPANYTCSIMEVIGSVNTDLSLKEIMCVPFGDNFGTFMSKEDSIYTHVKRSCLVDWGTILSHVYAEYVLFPYRVLFRSFALLSRLLLIHARK